MIGRNYWATGITVRYGYSGGGRYGWQAIAEFFDDGWAGNDCAGRGVSTEGRLVTRYHVVDDDEADGLTAAVDAVKADAERLGIIFRQDGRVFYENDGDSEDYPPPQGWRELVDAQASRLGWGGIYVR
jgi:hypothetical protein